MAFPKLMTTVMMMDSDIDLLTTLLLVTSYPVNLQSTKCEIGSLLNEVGTKSQALVLWMSVYAMKGKKKKKNIPASICGDRVLIVIEKKTMRKCEKSSLWGKGLPSPNKNFSHVKIHCMLQK